jgi:hypothetical protein
MKIKTAIFEPDRNAPNHKKAKAKAPIFFSLKAVNAKILKAEKAAHTWGLPNIEVALKYNM